MELGYAMSSEEHAPSDLIRHARLAEEAGFGFGLISDHIHPWTNRQGHSGFVWSVIAAIAQATEKFRLGTGENLNEHVTGANWPAPDERLSMLEEAVELMRELWKGDYVTRRGKHYTVENVRIFDVPDDGVDVAVAAMQPNAADLAGRIGDALINVAPKKEIVEKFENGGGNGKPKYGQVTVCWAKSKDGAKKTAFEVWPNALVEGSASQELPLPSDFEQLVEGREADELEETLTMGPDPEEYLKELKEYEDAGYTHAYIHQIGPDQEGFLDFARRELLPNSA